MSREMTNKAPKRHSRWLKCWMQGVHKNFWVLHVFPWV